jgi:hypothetical protein
MGVERTAGPDRPGQKPAQVVRITPRDLAFARAQERVRRLSAFDTCREALEKVRSASLLSAGFSPTQIARSKLTRRRPRNRRCPLSGPDKGGNP